MSNAQNLLTRWLTKDKKKGSEDTVKVEVTTHEVEEQPEEEWIWIEGYKGTDKDMKCRDFQYELGKQFDIPEGETVKECQAGFHLCRDLDDVFAYRPIDDNSRYFKVRALVLKKDYESYGEYELTGILYDSRRRDKLVAKSIILVRELTDDEILEHMVDISEWTEKDKKNARRLGVHAAIRSRNHDILVGLGYSSTFANIILSKDRFSIAAAVATQPELSMDMKVWMIFNA